MSEDWDYNTWKTADLQSLLEEIKGVLEEREENDNEYEQSYIHSVAQKPDDAPKKVIWLYGLTQSCWDQKGQFPVSSVDEIDTRYHWVDIEKLSKDKDAYWRELVEKYGWGVDELYER